MTKLAKWHVEEILENFVLGGFPVKDDDRFLACSSILTSMIVTVEVDEPNKAFIFHTMSGSEYICLFEDIRWTNRFAEFSKDNLERLKVSRAFVDEAIKLAHEKESSFVAWLAWERGLRIICFIRCLRPCRCCQCLHSAGNISAWRQAGGFRCIL